MTKRQLPAVPNARPMGGVSFNVLPRALERWNPGIQAAADSDSDRTISVLDVIGFDFWSGDGITAKRISGILRSMGEGPVTVNINSPGGDYFEGLAIYNVLREHPGEVTAKVLGMAASAASVIAMAADKIQIARAGFYMVHNVWACACGNRHDFLGYHDYLEPFDEAAVDVYSARTGIEREEIASLLDAETWINGSSAVEKGFAEELLPSDQVANGTGDAQNMNTIRRVEMLLRNAGVPKSEAMRLISEIKSSEGDPAGGGRGDPAGRARVDPAQVERLQARFENLHVFPTL